MFPQGELAQGPALMAVTVFNALRGPSFSNRQSV